MEMQRLQAPQLADDVLLAIEAEDALLAIWTAPSATEFAGVAGIETKDALPAMETALSKSESTGLPGAEAGDALPATWAALSVIVRVPRTGAETAFSATEDAGVPATEATEVPRSEPLCTKLILEDSGALV
ncbi:hypothetical protein EIP86_000122 [Pleurotus ostreatoroseus]|nr:hypothetical protein EIP86_000122 [Pleurotus ostreatoroseus]